MIHESNDGMITIREGDWKLELGLGSGGFSAPEHNSITSPMILTKSTTCGLPAPRSYNV
jgi:hypothetical protein